MEKPDDGGEFEDGILITPAAAEPKPKARRGARPPAPKKQPQRGLGVAQLERLRMQESWKMMNEPMESSGQVPIYDFSTISRAWVDAHHFPSKSAVPLSPTPPTRTFPALVYLPRCRSGIAVPGGAGYGSFPSKSAIQEHYSIDRFQFPAVEPPSNQTQPLCFSNQCEFCVGKKRLFRENPGMRCGDFLEIDLPRSMAAVEGKISSEYWSPRPIKFPRETELKEFDFFPRSPAFTADEESEFADAPSAAAGRSPSFIDLSLTL
ncbi:hypothetical protein KSP39_PZI001957 [Platanthera zijinensis]|uniref:Uncharacterized protein n=1 Tax=Platanthera zijinensis TaxID=2320716 RepID=A0AAP0C0Z4_9ASPA